MKKIVKIAALVLLSLGVSVVYASNNQAKINKENVVALFKAPDFKTASQYLDPSYIEHDPTAKPGIEGVKHYLETRAQEYPYYKVEIKRVIVDGNIVAIYAHEIMKPGEKGRALVDIYKLKNGKVVEHWDVIQPIAEASNNSVGMF